MTPDITVHLPGWLAALAGVVASVIITCVPILLIRGTRLLDCMRRIEQQFLEWGERMKDLPVLEHEVGELKAEARCLQAKTTAHHTQLDWQRFHLQVALAKLGISEAAPTSIPLEADGRKPGG